MSRYFRPQGEKHAVKVYPPGALRSSQDSSKFVETLQNFIAKQKEDDKITIFEDFDLSESAVTSEAFKEICAQLSDPRVQVERFRAYKCHTVGDEGAKSLAEWFAKVSHEMAPAEMHLSDCGITTDGFTAIMEAFSSNDAYPPKDPKSEDQNRKLPLYLRLEDNLIDEAIIQERIKTGLLTTFRKRDRVCLTNGTKVRLLVGRDGGFNQKVVHSKKN
jgi:hypothetical protein